MKSLFGKNVLITGAGAGIGKEMAGCFAQEKANLAIIDIDDRKLDDTAGELTAFDITVHPYTCDVSDRKQIEKTATAVKKDFGFIDIVINNAGVVTGKSIIDSSYEDIRKTIDINLMGVIWMVKQFLPEMTRKNSGHIVNIASAAGLLALPKIADYCATKFAVVGFSDALRMEMKKYGFSGVKISCICPSIIDTGMFDGFQAPRLNPILRPDAVAAGILKTVKKNKPYFRAPFMVKLIPLFKLLPTAILDKLGDLTGTSRAMDHFRGH